MTVTDGELQIILDVSPRHASQDPGGQRRPATERLRLDPRIGVPVLPVSTAEEPVKQLDHLLGLLPQNQQPRRRRGGYGGRAWIRPAPFY